MKSQPRAQAPTVSRLNPRDFVGFRGQTQGVSSRVFFTQLRVQLKAPGDEADEKPKCKWMFN
jgi:hypothetical protein